MIPETAWTVVRHSLISTKIIMMLEIVNMKVKSMQRKCQKNQQSFPKIVCFIHVFLKYRARKMPTEAVPIHAAIIREP